MKLDVDCLIHAKPEALERLARSLGVTLPEKKGSRWKVRWACRLVGAIEAAKERSDGQGGDREGGNGDRGGDR